MKNRHFPKKPSFLTSFLLVPVSLLFMATAPDLLGLEGGQGPVLKNRSANEQILKGIDLLYNRQFNNAEKLFRKLIAKSRNEPAGYFYLAMVSWSRLASGFWSQAEVNEFKHRIDRAIEVAEVRCDRDDAGSYDFFYLGGALGFKGRFELMKGNWVSSFFLARDAVAALKVCLKMDPDNKDVLLGLGTFDYYTAKLSGILKFLTYFLLHQGDKERGLKKLSIASREAIYSKTEARSVLLHIYLFGENKFRDALDLSTGLAEKYKRNPRFLILKGVSYIRLEMDPQYRAIVNQLRLNSAKASDRNRAAMWERRAFYLESTYDLFHGRYAEARSRLRQILNKQDPENDPAMIAWPLTKLGMSYELENNRDEAIKYYKRVLHMENASGAQFVVKKLLERPLKKGEPFIGY
ncbi:MAG: hypothetical protein JRH00_01295 [Deltaproteobacteria bacterium]|nr:hypothetical protein [Deltaproteobacteria bacterium]